MSDTETTIDTSPLTGVLNKAIAVGADSANDSIDAAVDDTPKEEPTEEPSDWNGFIQELVQIFVYIIFWGLIGANMVHLSNAPMKELNIALPSNLNSLPYKGTKEQMYSPDRCFNSLNSKEMETSENLFECLYPFRTVSFPYKFNMIELDQAEMGMDYYLMWPLKWLSNLTAWAWGNARLMLKYVFVFGKWIMTYFKSESIVFYVFPAIALLFLRWQITTMLGMGLMTAGGFMTDIKNGWLLALFALVVYVSLVVIWGEWLLFKCYDCCVACCEMCYEILTSFTLAGMINAVGRGAERAAKDVFKMTGEFFTLGQLDNLRRTSGILGCILQIALLIVAGLSTSFSLFWNSANGSLMTITFTLFILSYILFKNNGLDLARRIMHKHFSGLFLLFLLGAGISAKDKLTGSVQTSFLGADGLVILYTLYKMFF